MLARCFPHPTEFLHDVDRLSFVETQCHSPYALDLEAVVYHFENLQQSLA